MPGAKEVRTTVEPTARSRRFASVEWPEELGNDRTGIFAGSMIRTIPGNLGFRLELAAQSRTVNKGGIRTQRCCMAQRLRILR